MQGAAAQVDILKLDGWECWVKVIAAEGGFGGAGIAGGGWGVAVGGYVGVLGGGEGRGEVSVRVVKGGRWLAGIAGGEEGGEEGEGKGGLWGWGAE